MSIGQFLLRSLRYFWRTNLGVVLGATCATAVLVGALAVGDSVRQSLREQALDRIGQVDTAIVMRERYFREDLADRLQRRMPGARVSSALQFQGVLSVQGGGSRTGIVDVYGVDDRFFALGPEGTDVQVPGPGKALINPRLAEQLQIASGDVLLLRVEQPSALPRDMMMATVDDVSFAIRVEVGEIIGDEDFGRFSLRSSQIPPFNMFLSLPWLQDEVELEERANLLLVSGPGEGLDPSEEANRILRQEWSLDDISIDLHELEGRELFELSSDRVFLDRPVTDALARIDPSLMGVLTYFVNELRIGDRSTPYSMVAGIGPLVPGKSSADQGLARDMELLSGGLSADGIVLNRWAADDLQASAGDAVELSYYVMGSQLRLQEDSRSFDLKRVLPIAGAAADPQLMPAFPGLADADDCRDWEPGVPMDLELIRDEDEEYWDDHRGTPKAFIDLATAQSIWGNRFGELSAVRGAKARMAEIGTRLREELDPARLGLFFTDLRGPALTGGTSATDFGGLFLGLSFFLITAGLLLTALLFVFGVEQRANEVGLLLALGFRAPQVRKYFLAEAAILALIAAVPGALIGLAYTRLVLHGLSTLWQDAVGSTSIGFHVGGGTLAIGIFAAVLSALVAIALALRRTFSLPTIELLSSRNGIPQPVSARESRRSRSSLIVSLVCALLAITLVVVTGSAATQAAGAFFGAGALLLVSGLAGSRNLLGRLARPALAGLPSLGALGLRNSGRRPGRSLATIALLASGTFLVVAVQSNRLEPPGDPSLRASGTGGFTLFGRSTLPVLRDLDSAAGREAYALDDEDLAGVELLPLRVREGDDASCLNLSLPQNPRLVGVDASALAERGSFQFAGMLGPRGEREVSDPWKLLDADYGENVMPAIGDAASVTWTLHKGLGDGLQYVDEEGQSFHVVIVGTVSNSILQGNLVVAAERFERRFPSASGYRMFLIDVAAERREEVAQRLTNNFTDIGLELTATEDRMAAFNAVQNTYLLIFQVLGGLGLLLGSAGMGMVVLRNALERRSELALASALGFDRGAIRHLVWSEHGMLLALGIFVGVIAALLAIVPANASSAEGMSILPMFLLVGAVALSGALWVWLASSFATRGPLLSALKDE
ncbi:MAG: FtsX-like permease family protein [Planctomycetota bacterium]|jgi:ABC-type antimicrobial peptide transport system permease subunit